MNHLTCVKSPKIDDQKWVYQQTDALEDVKLEGVTISGKVQVLGRITANNVDVTEMQAKESILINSTICHEKLTSEASILAQNSQLKIAEAKNSFLGIYIHAEAIKSSADDVVLQKSCVSKVIDAKRTINAIDCEELGNVIAGDSAELINCPKVWAISSGRHVFLKCVTVQECVTAGGQANIEDSHIGGTLTCATKHLVIKNSIIDTIRLHCSSDGLICAEQNLFQTIELENSSVRHIIFEGGKGTLILKKGSLLPETVIGERA